MKGGSDLGWSVVLPRGPIPDIEPLSDEEESAQVSSNGAGSVTSPVPGKAIDAATTGVDDAEPSGKEKQRGREAHNDENARWEKAAKKATKDAGALPMHLAQS
jgi:hypothetical protein